MVLRLFVAVYPPVEVARALLARTAELGIENAKLVREEQVHLTLLFLGDRSGRELDDVKESVARSVSGLRRPELLATGLTTMPAREPHLVAAQMEADATISELHSRLAHRLARNPKDRRGFVPHMTTARFRVGRAAEMAIEPALSFVVSEAALVQSVLKPEGAEHRVVERFGFG